MNSKYKMKRTELIFKTIPEFPGYYACSNGKIFSERKNKINAIKSSGSGKKNYRELTSLITPGSKYLSVNLARGKSKVSLNIHKLIGWAFTGKSPFDHCFVHKKKNYMDNTPGNLQYFKLEYSDKNENRLKEIEIKELESILRKEIKYNYNSKIWKRYELTKLKGNLLLRINFIKLFLKSVNSVELKILDSG
jgi:hypothetical protein